MKKTRKVLSVVLSLLVALGSMPFVYTGTAAAGTIDNPTLPVSESGEYSQSETNNLTFSQKSLNFTFYQTVDDEYFKFTQAVDADKYCGSANISNTVNVDLSFALADDAATTSFINNNGGSITYVGNDSASSGLAFPESSSLEGSYWGTTEYSWVKTTTFKGAPAGQTGVQNYSYTQLLNHRVVIINSDSVTESDNSYSTQVTTNMTVIDARAFAQELAQAESVVANPENYSDAYVSANKAALNDIPSGLKSLSVVYSQEVVDSYTEILASIPDDCADYTEYNATYAEYIAFTNDEGIYTAQSYQKYIAEIISINSGLSKTLTSGEQATVDAATQAIKDAKELLVIEFDGTGATTQSDIEDVTPVVGNEFNFIQIKDNQVLAFTQPWTIYRGSKSSNRMFYITLDTTDANTAAFSPKFTDDCVETGASIISGGFEGTLTNQTIFTNWQEVDEAGNEKADVEAIIDGRIAPEYAGFQAETTYYLNNRLSFVGLSASESGAKTYTYVQRFYVNWTSWAFGTVNHYNSTTYTTTLNITDARALVEEYNNAVQSLNNPGLHSSSYITELQKIVNSVPQDMVNGTKYYTQAEVDAYYEQFAVLSENKADYSAFEAAYQRIEAILADPDAYSGATIEAAKAAKEQADAFDKNLVDSVANRELIAEKAASLNAVADNAETRANYTTYNQYMDIIDGLNPADYTGDAYREFMDVVNSVESTLPLDLPASQQSTVDEACNTLLNAYLKLTGGSITNPDDVSSPFTQDAITGEYTNGVIKFTLDYPEYNFTQTLNDEKLSIKTNLTISSADSSKVVELKALKISSLDQKELSEMDTSGNCYNSDSVTINNAENLFIKPNLQYNVVQGVELLLDANGDQYADTNGDMAWFTTWQNTAGVALSTDGLINDSTTLTTEDSSATAEFIFASAGGGDTETKTRSYTYVLRLAWAEDGVEHHAHIPVTFNISDARYLHSTYYAYMDFINAGNDGTYTDASFQAAADIMASVNTDVVSANGYYTQDQIDAESAKLANALGALQVKADYSQVDSLASQAEAMLNDTTKTYTQATIDALNDALAKADALNRDLAANDESNAAIQEVVDALQAAIDGAKEKADYTEFDKVVEDLEFIVNNPDNFTSETVENAEAALEDAKNVNKDYPSTEQGTLDDITNELKQVVESAKEKADYSGLDEAINEAQKIVDAPEGTYTEESVKKAQDALDAAEALDKDLEKNDENDAAIDKVIEDLTNAATNAKEKADYSGLDEAINEAQKIVDAPEGTYTDESVKAAQDALDAADALDKDLEKNDENDAAIDKVIEDLTNAATNAEFKADYSGYDEAYQEAQKIVDAPEGTYTDESVKAAQDALDAADALNKDLPASEQQAVTDVINGLIDAATNAKEKADYSGLDEAINEAQKIVDAPEGIYTEESVKKAQDALDAADALDKDLEKNDENDVAIDKVIEDLTNAATNAELKADYSGYDEAYQEAQKIVDAPEGTYTDESVKAAQDALDAADALNKDLPASEQQAVTDVINGLIDAATNAKEKADYSGLDEAINEAQKIVDAPEGTYTDESVKAAQDALDAAEALDKDLEKNDENDAAIDKVIEDLTNAATNAELKADYSGYDEAYQEAQKIVDAPEGTYTEESVKKAQDALDAADALDKDLPESEQQAVTDVINGLKDAAANAEKFADYSDYNTAKDEADKLVNDDGNGNPIYDEEAFEAYKEAVNNIDAGLRKDLLEDQQDVVDKATEELRNLRTELDATKGYEQEVVDPETTVDSIIEDVLQNSGYNADEVIFEFKDYTGAELAGEEFVGTGSTMRAILKSTGEIIDYKLYIVMGDVNGDGKVTMEDYEISVSVNLGDDFYEEEHNYFFIANDQDADGVIDALDTFGIRRMVK